MVDRGTKPSSSMISRPRWDRFRWRLSIGISSRAPGGLLYVVQRGYPAGALRRHGAAGQRGQPQGRGVRLLWLATALFTAMAGNPRHLCLSGWLENPVYFSPAGSYTFAHSSHHDWVKRL